MREFQYFVANLKTTIPRHIIIKLSKAKDQKKALNASKEKQLVTYKGSTIKLSTDFSPEILEARRKWDDIIKVLNEKIFNQDFIFSKIVFPNEREIKTFLGEQNLSDFASTRPSLQEMLKGVLQVET